MLLKFAPLLLITVLAVENGGNQFPPKTDEVQKNSVSVSRVTTRLDVYKSLAKLHHQPRDNLQPSISSDPGIVAAEEIKQSMTYSRIHWSN